jgi:hypothetical protein
MSFYRVGTNTFGRDGDGWVARDTCGKELARFNIGAQARSYLESLCHKDSPRASPVVSKPGPKLKRGEVHPDFRDAHVDRQTMLAHVALLRSSGWATTGSNDADEFESIRLLSPCGKYVANGCRAGKKQMYFFWVCDDAYKKLDDWKMLLSSTGCQT